MKKVGVIGAGSWGTAVADLLAGSGADVTLWGRDSGLVDEINRARRNPRYLKNIELSANIKAVVDLSAAVEGKDAIVLAAPSQAMRETVSRVAVYAEKRSVWLSLTKGFDPDTLSRMSEVIGAVVPGAAVAVLSGPNHAEEVSLKIPSATVIASGDATINAALQKLFMTSYFRVYTNEDIAGVETAGATKNIIAVVIGVSDGLGYGDNTKAALMTRGLAEMTRLGVSLGAKSHTFAGLAGIGDLIATCTSRHSRNRALGERLARGETLDSALNDMGMIAEGAVTVRAVCALAEKHGIDMPISRNVYDVIYNRKDPKDCVQELMSRGAAQEE